MSITGACATGSQVTRNINGQTFTLGYDAENRMVSVTGPSMNASFVYDGNGKRVKSTINGVGTVFVGNYYEVVGGAVTKYYFLGGARVAMRQGGALYYPLTDHLGSTSVTTDSLGNAVAGLRYKPWGETRLAGGTTLSKYQFTGQYNESELGLYYYNARWYDGSLGRFVQADTVVPDHYNTLDWDRYAYARSNPVRFTDPSGHKVTCDEDENCKLSQQLTHLTGVSYWKSAIKGDFGVKVMEKKMKWSEKNLLTAYSALSSINEKLNGKLKTMVSGTTFTMTDGGNQYYGITYSAGVTFHVAGSNTLIPLINFLHEAAHLIDAVPATKDVFSGSLPTKPTWVKDGYVNREILGNLFYQPVQAKPMNEPYSADEYWADAFANYAAGNIRTGLLDPTGGGQQMYDDVYKALILSMTP